MNSLTYISRQFDVLASSKTPPPTPISNAAFLTDPECSSSSRRSSSNQDALKRVKTWSSRAFLFPRSSQQHYTTRSPRRSFSSPADFFSISPLHRPSISTTLDGHIASKEHSQDTLNGLFLISVFMLLWKALCDAWASILGRKADTPSRETSVEAGSETDEKESEDETSDEKTPLIRRLQQPSLMPPASFHPSYSLKVSNALYIASSDELVHPSQIKAEPQALAIPPSSITTSRSSTPTLSTRKASFLTPKTLVLDLDETLIHSTSRPMYSSGSSYNLLGLNTFGRRNNGAGHTVEVVMGGRSTLYHVYKRPFVDFFLRKVRHSFGLIIWRRF
jgi:CTD nuclear envelope phosphatase 1